MSLKNFGMNFHLPNDAAVKAAIDLGLKWVRMDFNRAAFRITGWTPYDKAVVALTTAGVEIYGTLQDDDGITKGRTDGLDAWAVLCVSRFPQVTHWGVMNEPNLAGLSPRQYIGEALIPVSQAIRTTNAAAKVCGPEISISGHHWPDWVTAMGDAQALPLWDVFTWHRYADSGAKLVADIRDGTGGPLLWHFCPYYQPIAKAISALGKPQWLTEFGWQTSLRSGDRYASPDDQATFYQDVLAQLPDQVAFGYTLVDDPHEATGAWGIIGKPAYAAIQTLEGVLPIPIPGPGPTPTPGPGVDVATDQAFWAAIRWDAKDYDNKRYDGEHVLSSATIAPDGKHVVFTYNQLPADTSWTDDKYCVGDCIALRRVNGTWIGCDCEYLARPIQAKPKDEFWHSALVKSGPWRPGELIAFAICSQEGSARTPRTNVVFSNIPGGTPEPAPFPGPGPVVVVPPQPAGPQKWGDKPIACVGAAWNWARNLLTNGQPDPAKMDQQVALHAQWGIGFACEALGDATESPVNLPVLEMLLPKLAAAGVPVYIVAKNDNDDADKPFAFYQPFCDRIVALCNTYPSGLIVVSPASEWPGHDNDKDTTTAIRNYLHGKLTCPQAFNDGARPTGIPGGYSFGEYHVWHLADSGSAPGGPRWTVTADTRTAILEEVTDGNGMGTAFDVPKTAGFAYLAVKSGRNVWSYTPMADYPTTLALITATGQAVYAARNGM